jgi:hypothetical protein
MMVNVCLLNGIRMGGDDGERMRGTGDDERMFVELDGALWVVMVMMVNVCLFVWRG